MTHKAKLTSLSKTMFKIFMIPFQLLSLGIGMLQKENYIPPLDLLDAKKLDDMVSAQVSEALRPILQSEGHTEDGIKEILTRTSLGQKRFER
jgi:hypothetical protein